MFKCSVVRNLDVETVDLAGAETVLSCRVCPPILN